jgi:secondary thiamine-phosphate synthase enzyme
MLITLHVRTEERQQLVDMTPQIQEAIRDSGIQDGLCLVFCPHTTAGIVLNSHLDPATAMDLQDEIDRLVPTRLSFHHTFDTPSDAAGHIKTGLVGSEFTLPVSDGQAILGCSQAPFLWEFDGARDRRLYLKIMAG